MTSFTGVVIFMYARSTDQVDWFEILKTIFTSLISLRFACTCTGFQQYKISLPGVCMCFPLKINTFH